MYEYFKNSEKLSESVEGKIVISESQSKGMGCYWKINFRNVSKLGWIQGWSQKSQINHPCHAVSLGWKWKSGNVEIGGIEFVFIAPDK